MSINEETKEFIQNPSGDEVDKSRSSDSSATSDSSLESLVKQEQTLAFEKLKAELGRDPSQEEVDEWLSAHTESY